MYKYINKNFTLHTQFESLTLGFSNDRSINLFIKHIKKV